MENPQSVSGEPIVNGPKVIGTIKIVKGSIYEPLIKYPILLKIQDPPEQVQSIIFDDWEWINPPSGNNELLLPGAVNMTIDDGLSSNQVQRDFVGFVTLDPNFLQGFNFGVLFTVKVYVNGTLIEGDDGEQVKLDFLMQPDAD